MMIPHLRGIETVHGGKLARRKEELDTGEPGPLFTIINVADSFFEEPSLRMGLQIALLAQLFKGRHSLHKLTSPYKTA